MKSAQTYSRYLVVTVRISIVLFLCCLFIGTAWAAGLTDASVDDFGRGSGCYVSQSDTGQTAGAVILTPTAGTNFSGTVLASDWISESGSLLSGGNLLVNEGRAGTVAPPYYSPSRTLEFVATFQNAESQHIGFGVDLSEPPWAIFSTGDGSQLRARTDNGPDTELTTPLGTSYFGAPHLYRIDWQPTDVVYWIDGTPVVTHTVEFTQAMHPVAADFNTTTVSLALNWIRMSDYAPSPCTFESRVINSGADNTTWTNFTTTVAQPAGTAITFDVRASADNNTWSSWQMVTSTTISLTGRYVQYRAILTSTDPLVTPQLLSADFGGSPLAVELKSISAAPTVSPARSWPIVILITAGLLLGIIWQRFAGRKKPA
ncbi:hypothetical protein TFLX_05993 [Thermoflexales bacterium]|nr:hypothetical protein TFLX_05993 [Thermoflexales bacterium]